MSDSSEWNQIMFNRNYISDFSNEEDTKHFYLNCIPSIKMSPPKRIKFDILYVLAIQLQNYDICEKILKYLDIQTLYKCTQVSKTWKTVFFTCKNASNRLNEYISQRLSLIEEMGQENIFKSTKYIKIAEYKRDPLISVENKIIKNKLAPLTANLSNLESESSEHTCFINCEMSFDNSNENTVYSSENLKDSFSNDSAYSSFNDSSSCKKPAYKINRSDNLSKLASYDLCWECLSPIDKNNVHSCSKSSNSSDLFMNSSPIDNKPKKIIT